MTKRKIIWIVIFLFIIVGLSWWFKEKASARKGKIANQENYQVKKASITSTLDLPGQIIFGQEANLRFQTSGLLSWVGVKPGSQVRKGQAIASLDRRQLYKQLKKSLNSYYNTRLGFEDTQDEYRDVLDKSMVIQHTLEKSQKNLDNAVLDVELKHLAWQLAVIHAPFTGLIDSLTVPQKNTNITPSQATFHLINPKSAFFEAEIDELDLNKVKLNQKVSLSLDAYPQSGLSGKIKYISYSPTKGKSGSMVYLAKVSFDQIPSHINLRSGLNGNARIILSQKNNVLVIPINFLNYSGDKNYVWLKKGPKKVKQFIKIGIQSDDSVEVIQGLKAGDVISQ